MPIDLIAASAAADAGGGLLAPLFGHLTNVKNRKFTREMYQRQREDALSDWAMQNEYNSPRAQMQRFQEAGLNPALIYGQTNMAAPVRSSSAAGGSADAPRFGNVSSGLFAYQQVKHSQAQVDLLAKQMTIADEERLLKRAQTYSTLVGAGKTDVEAKKLMFELDLAKELKETTIEGAKANVQNILARTKVELDANEREAVKLAPTVMKALEEIASIRLGRLKTRTEIAEMKERIELLKKDQFIRQFDVDLTKQGIRPGDPVWYRIIAQLADELLPDMGAWPDLKKRNWNRLEYDLKGNKYGQKNRGAGGKW